MENENETRAIAVLPSRGAFDEAVKQLCFEIWLFLADRSAEDTIRILEERMASVAPDEIPELRRIPSVRTIQNWVKTEQWEHKANDLIRQTASHIDESQIARLFVLADKAIHWAHKLLDGDFDHEKPSLLMVKSAIVKEMLQFRGLGTAGAVGAPTLAIQINTSDTEAEIKDLSAQEKAQYFRNRVLERKQEKRLTGKIKDKS
jgi:hypothetical protein